MEDGSTDKIQDHVLYTEPSFAIYTDEDKFGEEHENEDDEGMNLERSATIGDSVEAEFSFRKNPMKMINEEDKDGLLIGFVDLNTDEIQSNSNDNDAMIRENPCSPLALRSYAHYLQSMGDFSGAEEYYSRAITVDPEDGETLCQYATMVWEVHGDCVKASDYFQRAAKASPNNNDVLAAYASFLWNINENEEEEKEDKESSDNAKKTKAQDDDTGIKEDYNLMHPQDNRTAGHF